MGTAANVAPGNDDFADAEPLVGAAGARSLSRKSPDAGVGY
jgi:hypothetical protein